jgi:hypothetical protein
MKKFINHVDHVAWLVRPENLDAHLAQMERVTGATLRRFSRADMGFTMCISWEAGLEVVCPHEERTEFNSWLWSELETNGEGVTSVVFGVKDLDWHRTRLEKMGIPVGPLMDDHADTLARSTGAVGARRRRAGDQHQHRAGRHRLCRRGHSIRGCLNSPPLERRGSETWQLAA